MRWRPLWPTALTVLVTAIGLLATTPAVARAQGSGYFVTFAARSCPSYGDIFANKARNDIQESLEDLGPDSPYNTNGESLVDPRVEAAAPQDACSPLPDWRFTLGHNFQANGSNGPWGSLSTVTDPFPGSIVTEDSTPLYDQYHQRIPDQSITGATTVELNGDEAQQVGQVLWTQGGTPDDPVLARRYRGPKYGFGALRCGTDALNGDNVEKIFFPAGVTHIFCYAFYVTPPPTSGTITIRKRVVNAPTGEAPAFAFDGSISYNPAGFSLQDGQSTDFFRAGNDTWDVHENPVTNYRLTSVDCSSTTESGEAGSSVETVTGRAVAIQLAGSEHVTCVYTNTYEPPRGGLTIEKITRGGTGQFGYTVAPAAGGPSRRETATTHAAGVPAAARPSLAELRPGDYMVTEHPPSSGAGRWTTVSATCGARKKPAQAVHAMVSSDHTTTCVFVNRFIPAGAISLAKVTEGATGSVNFLIDGRAGGQAQQLHQHAKTIKQGVAAGAVPDSAADATSQLRLGQYTIAEQAPPSEDPAHWTAQSVRCGGRVVPFTRGVIKVTLTQANPKLHCVYTDRFHKKPVPPPPPPPPKPTPPGPPGPPGPPPPPGPPGPPGPHPGPTPHHGSVPAYATTDLSVTKEALERVAIKGHTVRYRIIVHNRGPDAAGHVVLADQPRGRAKIVSVDPSARRCRVGRLIVCQLGNLAAGRTVAITVRLIPTAAHTPFVNLAAVGSATNDHKLSNNISRAKVRIITPPRHPVGCEASAGPVAHPAC